MELPAIQTGAGRRALHRCGSLLSGTESTGIRLPSRNHSRWKKIERLNGRVRSRPSGKMHDQKRNQSQWIRTPDVGCNFQRKLDRKSTRLNSSHVKISYA